VRLFSSYCTEISGESPYIFSKTDRLKYASLRYQKRCFLFKQLRAPFAVIAGLAQQREHIFFVGFDAGLVEGVDIRACMPDRPQAYSKK
jgi:hypothetical protein